MVDITVAKVLGADKQQRLLLLKTLCEEFYPALVSDISYSGYIRKFTFFPLTDKNVTSLNHFSHFCCISS